MIREYDGYLYGPERSPDSPSPWVVRQWLCDCHPMARWSYFSAYDSCPISDLNYAGSPTYGERYDDWASLAAAHPSVRPIAGMDPDFTGQLVMPLRVEEQKLLAYAARQQAQGQLDPRNYAAGRHPDGGIVLREDWHTRQERADRWQAIADWFHTDPSNDEAVL